VIETSDPYAALVAFAERERVLVDDGRVEELAVLTAQRDAYVAQLPAQAPRSALPHLERAQALQVATAAKLRATLDELRRTISGLERGRERAHAYAAGPAPVAVPRIDQAA
jgi:hypothetical protein